MQKFEKILIYKQIPIFLFSRTSVPSSPLSLSLLTLFSLTPFGVRAPSPPRRRGRHAGAATGRPRVVPRPKPASPPPVFSPTRSSLAPCASDTRPRRPSACHAAKRRSPSSRRRPVLPMPVVLDLILLEFPVPRSPSFSAS